MTCTIQSGQGRYAACTGIGFDDHVRQTTAKVGHEEVLTQTQMNLTKGIVIAAQAQWFGQHQL